MKDRVVAALLAFFLGGLGAHKFYLGETGMGCFYLLFWWTGIPQLVAWIEGILYLVGSKEAFDRRYNRIDNVTVVVQMSEARSVYPPVGEPVTPRKVQQIGPAQEYKHRRPRDEEERERFVLQAASDQRGVLTPADLALTSQLSLREAKESLEALRKQGVCDLEIEPDTGLVQYLFPEFQPRERMADRDTKRLDDELDVH